MPAISLKLFSTSCFFVPLCLFVLKCSQKSQLFLRMSLAKDTAALWLNGRTLVMGLFLEVLSALILNLGAGLWLEDQPDWCLPPRMTPFHGGRGSVGLVSAWEYHLILRCFLWDAQEFKQIWEWEGKQVSEILSKAFKLDGVSERGKWRCKSWGNQPTFIQCSPEQPMFA